MQPLSNDEILAVSGATAQDANVTAAGIAIGAAAGFLAGGPIGAVAGAISVGVHAALISHYGFG